MELKDFKKIIGIIEDRDEVKVDTNVSPFGNSIYIFSSCYESELYIKKSLDTLIISRAQFRNKRVGIMTEVLNELIEIANMYELKKIKCESVLSKEMSSFCIKNKFKQLPGYSLAGYEYVGDYELILENSN